MCLTPCGHVHARPPHGANCFRVSAWCLLRVQTLGVDLVVMTPARGYCAELSAVVIIALATVYGLPVSTTQVMVRA